MWSRLYSNQPDLFEPIDFTTGLNVIYAEIRLPQNRNRDTHNLGKSILGRLLDFGFLLGRDNKFFLFKHDETFRHFVFFLEISLPDGTYLTVRRGVEEATKISFKKHSIRGQDFTSLPDAEWDHAHVPFDRAREILDSLLDWRTLKPWTFRHSLGYLLRSQDDYRDVFQLKKFGSTHGTWKPFLAHVLGFHGELVARHYAKEEELAKSETMEKTIKNELGGSIEDLSKIEGILLLKQQEAIRKQELLDDLTSAPKTSRSQRP